MKMRRSVALWCALLVFPAMLIGGYISARELNPGNNADKNSKYVCSETNPGSMCNASTTCGSPTSPCVVSVRRSGGNAAAAKANTQNAKDNAPFCVKVGSTVTFQGGGKNTGFVLDFGPTSPFDTPEGTIIGGSDRPVSLVAKRAGCYKYSVGACVSGSIYGMCGSSNAELVVTE